MVYNFEVAEHHNYFVSNDGYLVHNACGGGPGANGGYGRGGQKLHPSEAANGAEHTAFKTNSDGKVTSYETFTKPTNPKNKQPYESIRFDGTHEHHNKVTKQDLMPHIHDRNAPGGLREPLQWERPKGY